MLPTAPRQRSSSTTTCELMSPKTIEFGEHMYVNRLSLDFPHQKVNIWSTMVNNTCSHQVKKCVHIQAIGIG